MNNEIFVQSVKNLCQKMGVSPTEACRDSGAGRSMLDNVKRGRSPSIDKVQLLASYFGVTTSQLLGEVAGPSSPSNFQGEEKKPTTIGDSRLKILADTFEQLNEEGQEKLVDYASDLVASGRYIKTDPSGMGQKEA